ncbi:MAG: D-TA family PLP-dependent enzyme [Aureliella sp.]
MVDVKAYALVDPSNLITPCLLVYPEQIQRNLEAMLKIAGGAQRLRPHVKTHKTPQIVQLEIGLGITKHKCATLREAEMLAECGAKDVLVAYPQLGPAIGKFLELASRFPETRFSTLVDHIKPARQLLDAAGVDSAVGVWIDIDNGMHRTGIPAEHAMELVKLIAVANNVQLCGLHVYDGQNHQPSRDEREQAVTNLMQPVQALIEECRSSSIEIRTLVCGGTPTFPVFAQLSEVDYGVAIELSPGTSVLSDFNYGRDYEDLSGIKHAAVLMTRVISKQPESGQFTCDLGNKAVAADPPAGSRCHFLGLSDVSQDKQNEEHLIVRCKEADQFSPGDVLYALPAHICPTVALHRYIHPVVDGKVVDQWEVVARDRIYS